MKTESLVELLAQGAGAAPRYRVQVRLLSALGGGLLLSLLVVTQALGLNAGLAQMGWGLGLKLAYIGALLLASGPLVAALGRPGAPIERGLWRLAAVVAVMAAFAFADAGMAPAGAGQALLFGESWLSCPWRVAALSAPVLATLLWALRGLAPTRPRLAGFVAGLAAGAAGALAYALHCPETSALFVLTWYTLGMLLPALLGAALGPRLLRW